MPVVADIEKLVFVFARQGITKPHQPESFKNAGNQLDEAGTFTTLIGLLEGPLLALAARAQSVLVHKIACCCGCPLRVSLAHWNNFSTLTAFDPRQPLLMLITGLIL